MKATTTDFVEFSPAVTYLDVGYSVIDTTMVHDQSSKKFYRFTKDERVQGSGPDRSATGKFIFEEFGDTIDGKWPMIKKGIGQGMIKQGEGPLIFRDNARPDKVGHFSLDGIRLIEQSGTCSSMCLEVCHCTLQTVENCVDWYQDGDIFHSRRQRLTKQSGRW